jgi:hypothetical protein
MPLNYSLRPCSNDWDLDGKLVRFGPYCYGQHVPNVPNEYNAVKFPAGTLHWSAPIAPVLDRTAGRVFKVRCRVIRDGAPGWARVETLIIGYDNGIEVGWSEVVLPWQLLGPTEVETTHVPFVFMYGGDSLKYGPKDLQVTSLRCSDFVVKAI